MKQHLLPERAQRSVKKILVQPGAVPKETGAVLRKWMDQFKGGYLNADTGWIFSINKETVRHVVNQHGIEWKDALAHFPEIIQNAVWLGRDLHREYGKAQTDGRVWKIKWQHRLYATVDIAGEPFLLKLRANETLAKDYIYNINGAEIKKLTTINTSKDAAVSSVRNIAELADLVKRAWPKDQLDFCQPKNEALECGARKLHVNPVYKFRGGLRAGSGYSLATNYTWPFATMEITSDSIRIGTFFSKYVFEVGKIHFIKKYDALFSKGVQIFHEVNTLPKFIVFWTLQRKSVLKCLSEYGYCIE